MNVSYLTARQVLQTFSWKWVLRKHVFHSIISINHVTKDTAELRKLSTMPKDTFYRNLKKVIPTGYHQEKAGKWQTPGSQSKWWKISLPKNPHSQLKSTLQINREVQTSKNVNVSKSTLYWTSRKAEQIITFQLLKSLMDSMLGRFQRCIYACREIIQNYSWS